MHRRSHARWTDEEDQFIMDYIAKDGKVLFSPSWSRLAKEIAEKLERSVEGVLARIYKLNKVG